jgi:hypothetical protein
MIERRARPYKVNLDAVTVECLQLLKYPGQPSLLENRTLLISGDYNPIDWLRSYRPNPIHDLVNPLHRSAGRGCAVCCGLDTPFYAPFIKAWAGFQTRAQKMNFKLSVAHIDGASLIVRPAGLGTPYQVPDAHITATRHIMDYTFSAYSTAQQSAIGPDYNGLVKVRLTTLPTDVVISGPTVEAVSTSRSEKFGITTDDGTPFLFYQAQRVTVTLQKEASELLHRRPVAPQEKGDRILGVTAESAYERISERR